MKMKVDIRKLSQKKSHVQRTDLFLASQKEEEELHLKIAIQLEAAEKLNNFLKEKGLPERWGIRLLIDYGLSDEGEGELEKLRAEMQSQMRHFWGKHAIVKFRAYELFTENARITFKLNILLSENRSLKRRLKDEGLQDLVPGNEWDDWDNAATGKYYSKCVFMNRP